MTDSDKDQLTAENSADARQCESDAGMSAWWSEELPELKQESKDLLLQYSKIPPEQLESHIRTIRDKAWQIHPYPCIGQFRFLDLAIHQYANYPEILSRLRSSSGGHETFLDLGCAFAGDLRKLVSDGVDSSRCYGSDLQRDFIELGYELFDDRATLKSRFIVADIFDPESDLKLIDGEIDIISASSFFHLFGWDEQKRVAHRVVNLLKPKAGSMIVGRQVGNTNPSEVEGKGTPGRRFRHSPSSWKRFWEEVGRESEVEFEVSGREHPLSHARFAETGDLWMEFCLRRK